MTLDDGTDRFFQNVGTELSSHLQGPRAFQLGLIGCPETPVQKYKPKLCKIPE